MSVVDGKSPDAWGLDGLRVKEVRAETFLFYTEVHRKHGENYFLFPVCKKSS